MRTQSMDTAPEIERVLIRGHQSFSPAKRFAIIRGMTGGLTAGYHHSFRERNPSLIAYLRHLYGRAFDGCVSPDKESPLTLDFDILQSLTALTDVLTAQHIPWALTGGIAVCLYGFPRTVSDIDILIDATPSQRDRLFRQMGARWLQGDPHTSLLDRITLVKVDLLLEQPPLSASLLIAQARRMELIDGGLTVPVLSPEDLILIRLYWYDQTGQKRDDHWNDLMGIVKIQAPTLNIPFLKEQADYLGYAALWKQLAIDTEVGGSIDAATHECP